MCTDLTEEISREVFVNAEGSPLLLGNAGESGGEGSLCVWNMLSACLLLCFGCDAMRRCIEQHRGWLRGGTATNPGGGSKGRSQCAVAAELEHGENAADGIR